MKYELIKQFPGSGMVVGETNSSDDLDNFYPHLYPEFFKLVECNFEGRIIKVGDKIGDLTIVSIDYNYKTVFFDDHSFMWMEKIPYYYSVIDWKVFTHCGPPIIETQFTCNNQADAEKFVLFNYPCISLAEALRAFDEERLKEIVQKKLDERPS